MDTALSKKSERHGIGWLLFLVVIAVLILLGVANQRAIKDWLALRGYQAPGAVAALASDDGLTSHARKIFYVNHPALETKANFNKYCSSKSEQTIVIGCYHSGQSGIYLLRVSDPRLAGVEQVTAAHEMLHAAYERLDGAARKKLDAQLLDYYHHGLHDPRILATIAAYKKSEPSAVVNEMHSVFGTEVANLPGSLEGYYKSYFKDRSQVVKYADSYESEFTSRKATIKNFDARLADLKSQIGSAKATLAAEQAELASRQTQLNAVRATGDTSGYNTGVDAYNALVKSYNLEVESVKGLVGQYNQIISARNSIVLEEQQLASSLDSHVSTINPK